MIKNKNRTTTKQKQNKNKLKQQKKEKDRVLFLSCCTDPFQLTGDKVTAGSNIFSLSFQRTLFLGSQLLDSVILSDQAVYSC